MEDSILTQLLEQEAKFAEAQILVGCEGQTELLTSHLELHSLPSSNCELTIEDVQLLLQQKGPFNLALNCSICHQSLFADDSCAEKDSPRPDLEPCCLKMLSNHNKFQDLEVSFWWFCISSPTNCILTIPNYTRFMLTNGIPPSLRDRLWGVLTQSCDSTGKIDDYMERLYESLNTDLSPDIGIISKDVSRTFPELSMFNDFETKLKFEKILNAYSIFDSDMGYCQGLQFIVAPMLFHFKDELKTFNGLVKLFEMNQLRNIYDNEMSGLNLWFYQFEQILKLELPGLFEHFSNLEIDLNIFLSQWFLSFYSITIPFSFLIRIFDFSLFEGVKQTLLRVGIIILLQNEKLLMTIDEPELIYQHLLSENCWGVFANDVELFINLLTQLKISNFTIEKLYEFEMKHEDLKSNKSFFMKFLSNFKSSESIISNSDSLERRQSLFSSNTSLSINEDLEMMENLYKLCRDKGISDPLLDKVKERLYS